MLLGLHFGRVLLDWYGDSAHPGSTRAWTKIVTEGIKSWKTYLRHHSKIILDLAIGFGEKESADCVPGYLQKSWCHWHRESDKGSWWGIKDSLLEVLSLWCWKDLHRKCPQNEAEIEFSTWRNGARGTEVIHRGAATGVDRAVRNSAQKSRD